MASGGEVPRTGLGPPYNGRRRRGGLWIKTGPIAGVSVQLGLYTGHASITLHTYNHSYSLPTENRRSSFISCQPYGQGLATWVYQTILNHNRTVYFETNPHDFPEDFEIGLSAVKLMKSLYIFQRSISPLSSIISFK